MGREVVPSYDKDIKEFMRELVRSLNENFDHLDGQGTRLVKQLQDIDDRLAEVEDFVNADTVPEHDHSAEDEGDVLDPDTSFEVSLYQSGIAGLVPRDGDEGPEGMTIVGPSGKDGKPGLNGMPGLDGSDGEEGLWFPGPPGATGATGAPGAPGSGSGGGPSMPMPLDPLDPEEPMWLPGPKGDTGATGAPGAPGSGGSGAPLLLPADLPEDPYEPMLIPGPAGAQGPSGLSTGTQLRTLWLPAGSWEMFNGATPATIGSAPDYIRVLDFSASLDQNALTTIAVPTDWASGSLDCTLVWAAGGADTGNCRWQVNAAELASGDGVNEASVTTTVTPGAPGVSGTAIYTDVADFLTPTAAGRLIRLVITRTGAHASDTFLNLARLIGIRIEYLATTVSGAGAPNQLYAPGAFTVPTGNFRVWSKRLQLTGSERATLQGTARMRIT